MSKMPKYVVTGLVAAGVLVSNASAAGLPAPDFSSASTDVATVVVAIIAFLITIFGFKKVIGLVSGK